MEISNAIEALAALAQETRMNAYRALVGCGEDGCCAGDLGRTLGVPAATLSFHLKALRQAGLLAVTRCGRELHYRARPETLDGVMQFLNQHCCSGGVCGPFGKAKKG